MIVVNGKLDSDIRKVEQKTGKNIQGFRKLDGMFFQTEGNTLKGVSAVYELETDDFDSIYLITE